MANNHEDILTDELIKLCLGDTFYILDERSRNEVSLSFRKEAQRILSRLDAA